MKLTDRLKQCAEQCGNYGDGAPDSSGPAKQCLEAEQMLIEAAKYIEWCEAIIEERAYSAYKVKA